MTAHHLFSNSNRRHCQSPTTTAREALSLTTDHCSSGRSAASGLPCAGASPPQRPLSYNMPTQPRAVWPASAGSTGRSPPVLGPWMLQSSCPGRRASGFSGEEGQTGPAHVAESIEGRYRSPHQPAISSQTDRFRKRLESFSSAKRGPPGTESPSRRLVRLWELSAQGECCLQEERAHENSKSGLRSRHNALNGDRRLQR